MFARFCRFAVVAVLAPLVALTATLPPEHLHESDEDHDSVAHRHAELHDAAPVAPDAAEVDHGDGHIVWLDDVRASQATYRLPAPAAMLSDRVEVAQTVPAWIATHVDAGPPPHGPPRLPRSLRAPPISSL